MTKPSLAALVRDYFSLYYSYHENQQIKGKSGRQWELDGIMEANSEKYGIIIKDWWRSMGVDQVVQAARMRSDLEDLMDIIIITNYFSEAAGIRAEKLGIPLLTANEIFLKSQFMCNRRENL